jgi:hypothetical protein
MSSWMGVRVNNASTYDQLLQLAFGYHQIPTFASEQPTPEPCISPAGRLVQLFHVGFNVHVEVAHIPV